MKSGKRKPRQTAAETRVAGLLVSDAPNVVTLVWVCGNPFGLRRDGDRIKILKLGRQ